MTPHRSSHLSNQHVEQRRLPRPGCPDDGENLPRSDRSADSLEDLLHPSLLAHDKGLRLGNLHAEADVAKAKIDLLKITF